jgi:anti-anti-sigma factor
LVVSAVHEQEVGRVILVGELDLSGVGQLAATVGRLLRNDLAALQIDAGDLRFVDSAGLKSLLEIRDATEAAGAEFRLEPTSKAVARVIAVAGLTDVLRPT